MQLTLFDGGLSIRKDPSLIAPNEAVTYNNINSDVGVLQSSTSYLTLSQLVYGFFYKFNSTWLGSDQQRSYAEYNNKLYVMEDNKLPQVYSDNGYRNMGIAGPSAKLELTQGPAAAEYSQQLAISSQGTAARDLHFTDDGYDLFVLDETGDGIDHYELSTAWDIITAAYKNTFSIASQETNAMGLTFKPNGTRFYVTGNNKHVYEYAMAVAWDITTASYVGSADIHISSTTPQGLSFSDDGKTLFVLDSTTGRINQYTLTTAYLMSSIVFSGNYLSAGSATADSALTGLFFNNLGTRLYLVGYTNDKVYEFVLGTAWDITTAVYYGIIGNIATESTTATGLFFSPDLLNLYIVTEPSASKLVQYNVKRISSADAVIQYVYTYYNSVDNVESVPSPISTELSLKAVRSITITGIKPSTDPQVDRVRIYRIGDNATSFTRVAEIASTETSYKDSIPTIDLEDLLDSQDFYPAPANGKYLVEANGIMFCAVGTKLRFSIQGIPTAWPESYFISFGKVITGLLPITDGLLVFMLGRIDIILGSAVNEFVKRNLSEEHGCINHYTARYVQNFPVWQSQTGFCVYSSGSIKVITRDKLGLTAYSVINTAVWDETYFALLSDGSILALDTKYDSIRYKTFSYDKIMSNILAVDGVLYARSGNILHSLFTGAPLELSYKSPVFKDENYTEIKTYNNIYVKSNGTFSFKVYIDGELVKTYAISGNTTHDLKVPQEKQKGYSIQFEIIGTGTVHEIEYKVMGRQNGR